RGNPFGRKPWTPPRGNTDSKLPADSSFRCRAYRRTHAFATLLSQEDDRSAPLPSRSAFDHASHEPPGEGDKPTPDPSQEGNWPRRTAPLLGGAGGGFMVPMYTQKRKGDSPGTLVGLESRLQAPSGGMHVARTG